MVYRAMTRMTCSSRRPPTATGTGLRTARFQRHEEIALVIVHNNACPEACLFEQAEPDLTREKTADVEVVLHGETVSFLHHVDEVRRDGAVGRIRIERPFEIADGATLAIVAAVLGRWLKGLPYEIGREQSDATRLEMHGGGLDGTAKVVFARQVHDRVVDEDGIEDAPEPHAAHVADEMLALGIDRAADLDHAG